MDNPELTRQQLCAALSISESTVRRLESLGLPFTPIGARGKRYNLDEVRKWLRGNQCQFGQTTKAGSTLGSWSKANEFTAACRRVQLRVMPSN